MKKIVSLLLVLTMFCSAVMFNACGNSECTICGKEATCTFQGSKYCSAHYTKAVAWAMTHKK